MRTKKETEALIAELEKQKLGIITEFSSLENQFNANQKQAIANFQNHANKQQQTVSHIEGRIIQLQDDLNEIAATDTPASSLLNGTSPRTDRRSRKPAVT